MSRLHLLILWILAITAGILYFKRKDVPPSLNSQTKLETGSSLVGGDTVESLKGFKIEDGEETVTVQKIDGEWVVAEMDNFPANLTTVTRIIEALRETKIAQGVVASDEYYDRFNLAPSVEDKEERPTTITLLSGDEEGPKLFLGKVRTSTGGNGGTAGRFVRRSDDDSGVYIVSENFSFLGASPDTWIEKFLTPLEEGVIKIEVTAINDETFKPWIISRKTVLDDFLVEGLGEKEETKTNETGTLKTILKRAPFIDLLGKEEYDTRADAAGTRVVKATDSAGTTFLITITPEKQAEKKPEEKEDPAAPIPAVNYLLAVEILNGPTKPTPPAEDADIQEKAVYQERIANLADLSASVNRMRKIYKGRYFLVNKNTIGSLTKNRGELIQPKKEKKAPVSVTTDPIRVPTPGISPVPTIPGNGTNEPPASIARPPVAPTPPKSTEESGGDE